jgi:hypothetical protein
VILNIHWIYPLCVCMYICMYLYACVSVFLYCDKIRKTEWLSIHWLLKVNISCSLNAVSYGDWRWALRGKLTCPMSKGWWLLESQIAWDVFVLSSRNHFFYTKILIQNLAFFEMSEISSQFNLVQIFPGNWLGNPENKMDLEDRRWPQCTASLGFVDCKGRGLRISDYAL